jgi:hypothetical protein
MFDDEGNRLTFHGPEGPSWTNAQAMAMRKIMHDQAEWIKELSEKELALRAENERLKAELAEKEEEILKLNQMYPATAYTLEVEKQLAAALAACEAKDAALESLISHTLSCEQRLDEFHGLGNDSGSGCSIELCNASAALAIKSDTSALRQHDNALIERCAQVCVALERPDCWAAKECTLNIRLLKDPS